jgi:hypothetical protein
VDGVGLYPFTADAILNMAERTDPQIDRRFNPRRMMKTVLGEVLESATRDLGDDHFPGERLLNAMDGRRLPLDVEDALKRADPENFVRQRTILELWGPVGQAAEFPEELYAAFAVPKPSIEFGRPLPLTISEHLPVDGRGSQPSISSVDRRLGAVRAWGQRRALLTQDVVQELRDPLYALLEAHVDWDAAGLERASFAGRNAAAPAFRAQSINFHRQEQQPRLTGLSLLLPLKPDDDDELRQTTLALEGILQFQQHRKWDFPGAFPRLVALSECLDRWSCHLLAEIRKMPDSSGTWDPVATAVELLAVGSTLGGLRSATSSILAEALNALFVEEWPPEAPAQSREWQVLYQRLRERQKDLRQVVLAWASAGKGGVAGGFIDPERVMPHLRRVRRGWELVTEPPSATEARRDVYTRIANLHQHVRAALPGVAQQEYAHRRAWLDLVRRHMDPAAGRARLAESAQALRDAYAGAGVSGVRPSVQNSFQAALETFRAVQLDAAIRAVEELGDLVEPVKALPELARTRAPAMAAAEQFFQAAEVFLQEVEAAIQAERAALRVQVGEGVERDHERIRAGLANLQRYLETLGGEHVG